MPLITFTHPHDTVNIKDESAGTRVRNLDLILHKPLMFIRAAKGDDKPFWGNGQDIIAKYGSQTFDQFEKYWRGEQFYLTNAILNHQSCFVQRVIPADAKKASLVIEAHVKTEVPLTQYRRDDEGRFVYDGTTGEKIPLTDATGQVIKENGVVVKYMARQMTEAEITTGYNKIKVTTIQIGDTQTKVYPIVGVLYKDACEMGNKSGIKLFIDGARQTGDLVEYTSSLLWSFVPMEQPYNSNTAYAIVDKYDAKVNQMVMRPNQLDPYTNRRISAEDTLLRLFYNEVLEEYLLPYDIHFYHDNIETIGGVVRGYETNNVDLVSDWMVNITSMEDMDGNPYYHAQLDESSDSIRLTNLTLHYLKGGSDGDISDEAFETGIQEILSLRVYPELADRFRYPITHLYDVGYSLQTKFAMADFMGAQGYCKITMAAQDSNRALYSMDEAVSVAAAIRARCAITPESDLYGTEAMRATIFAQAGYINDTSVKTIIPMTFWAAERRSTFHNATYIKGSWGASPENIVDIYRDINFIPHSASQKQLLWDGAANYMQYKTMNTKFMPSVRSIYKDTTSLLADDEFTDACVYLKYIADFVWTEHVSRRLPFAALAELVQKDINTRGYKAFGAQYTVSARVYLSAEDLSNHDTASIEVGLEGDYPKRIWNYTIIARGRSETTNTAG